MGEDIKQAISLYKDHSEFVLKLWSYLYIAGAAFVGYSWKELGTLTSRSMWLVTGLWVLFGLGNLGSMTRYARIAFEASYFLERSSTKNAGFDNLIHSLKYPDLAATILIQLSFVLGIAVLLWLPRLNKSSKLFTATTAGSRDAHSTSAAKPNQ